MEKTSTKLVSSIVKIKGEVGATTQATAYVTLGPQRTDILIKYKRALLFSIKTLIVDVISI